MFDGQLVLDESELKQMNVFLEKAKKRKYSYPASWTPSMIYRFLQASDFAAEKTYNSMLDYDKWKLTLPVPLDEAVDSFLVTLPPITLRNPAPSTSRAGTTATGPSSSSMPTRSM